MSDDLRLMELLADCADAMASGAALERIGRRVESVLECTSEVEDGVLRLRFTQPPTRAEVSFAGALASMSQLAQPLAQHPDGAPLDPQGFLHAAEQAVAAARLRRHPLTVAVVEVEGMELGPGVDEAHLVARVGGVARECVRTDDLVGHLGANQFALLLPRTGAFEARVAVRRFRAALGETLLDGERLVSELVGYAGVEDGASAAQVLAAARTRLAAARRRLAYRRPSGPTRPIAG
jgi:GGDEF domain-containing protein